MATSESVLDRSLVDAAVRECHEQGFGLLRDVFAAGEIAELDADARRLLERADLIDTNNLRCRWQDDVETGACLFDAFDPVVDLSPACARVANDSRILQLLAAYYEEPARLFKDKLIFKPPGAKGYGLHQDYIAWPTFPRSFATVVVPIDAADSNNGCIEVFTGLHKRGCLSPEDGQYHELSPADMGNVPATRLALAPGDVAFFGGFTPHRSAPNRSRKWRRQLYLSYNAVSDGGDYRAQHYREFEAWLRERYAEYGRTEVYFA